MSTRSPIPMLLFCPKCDAQHVDAPSPGWDNPPHRSHLCHACGHIWRPCDEPTTGVAAVTTEGEKDSPRVLPRRQPLALPLPYFDETDDFNRGYNHALGLVRRMNAGNALDQRAVTVRESVARCGRCGTAWGPNDSACPSCGVTPNQRTGVVAAREGFVIPAKCVTGPVMCQHEDGTKEPMTDILRDAGRWRALMRAGVCRHESDGQPPVLASITKRIWYHATDDQEHNTLAEAMDAYDRAHPARALVKPIEKDGVYAIALHSDGTTTDLNDKCPECGRIKAHSAQDAADGLCPKWWAIRDPEADADCERHARTCIWTGGDDGPLEPGCNPGQPWYADDGLDAPPDWMRFCPFCGKPPTFPDVDARTAIRDSQP